MTFTPPPAPHRWLYPCRVLRVIDGDTVEVLLDRGFHDYAQRSVRLLGVNCPEIHAPDPAPGEAARQFTDTWIATTGQPDGAYPFLLESNRYEKYGRTLGTLWRPDGACLNADLLTSGHAAVLKD